MPSTEQILKVLKNERECIARQSRPLGEMPQCRKDEDGVKLCEYCDLCLSDTEILEVYDFLINGYELLQNEGADSYTIRCKKPCSVSSCLHGKIRTANGYTFEFANRDNPRTEIEISEVTNEQND